MAKAKKKASKKVTTKLDAKKAKGQTTEEVLSDVVEEMSEEEVAELLDEADEVIDAGSAISSITVIDEKPLDKDEFRKVKIRIPVHLKIKRRYFAPGIHEVEKHMVPTIMEMVAKKQEADLSIFTGKNFLVKRLLDRSLVVQEVENLDLKKMAQ